MPKVKRRRFTEGSAVGGNGVNRRSSNCQNLSSSMSKFPLTPSTPMLFFPLHFGLMSASEAICLCMATKVTLRGRQVRSSRGRDGTLLFFVADGFKPPTQPGQRVKARTNCGGLPAGNTVPGRVSRSLERRAITLQGEASSHAALGPGGKTRTGAGELHRLQGAAAQRESFPELMKIDISINELCAHVTFISSLGTYLLR